MIDLYPHNEEAYIAAIQMLAETNRTAIIHPTGTGKSFIGFKLCEDNPNKTVCWLSPSVQIYRTQLENLMKSTGGFCPNNIKFYTYHKLNLMSDEELDGIQPDYIILDEFHRCGAEEWGKSVHRLLGMYSKTPVMGLSATNIRYLDHQRDMAAELFEGNVASEITLGEAIVRGILKPPTYITALYSYQKDLERYENRVKVAKTKIARDAGEKYLEKIRRTLEKSEGLDVIFSKHMKEKHGKYIVFCANFEHMNEMIEKVPEWFGKIESKPRIYKVYSVDDVTIKEFEFFKNDTSNHLRLLFCIDMLNEGVHVQDIDGVILFRPTTSPIIFKQQIGRALATGTIKEPLIFDIVNNFESLYSIGAVEEEMYTAINYYENIGENDAVINERFTIIDEIKDCRILFNQLDDILSTSWDLMYEQAKQYYREYGHLQPPKSYKTASGYALGMWVQTQRRVYRGLVPGIMDAKRIEQLNSIGMVWQTSQDYIWNKYIEAAKTYNSERGDLDMPAQYVTPDGIRLGRWISNIRSKRKDNKRSHLLSEEQVAELNDLGMVWDKSEANWQEYFNAAEEYYLEHGHLLVPSDYTTENNIKLGSWIFRIRSAKESRKQILTDEQINKLDSIGMSWESRMNSEWDTHFAEASNFYNMNKHLNIPVAYKSEDGFALGKWIRHQREYYAKGTLKDDRVDRLNSIHMIWEEDTWMPYYNLCKEFYEVDGSCNIPTDIKANGMWIGKWLKKQQNDYMNGKLTPDKRRLLRNIEAIK